MRIKGSDFTTTLREIADMMGNPVNAIPFKKHHTTVFNYLDKDSNLRYRKTRVDYSKGRKPFISSILWEETNGKKGGE